MTPLEHAAAAADQDLHPEARAAALDALCASVREGLGYRLPDGTVTRLWREAHRAWLAAATGRTPGQAGRPRTRAQVERRPKPGRPPGRVRVPLSLRVLPEVAEALRADPDGPSRAVERMVMAASPRSE